MKHNTLVKRIEKLGFSVEESGNGYVARGKNIIAWYKQGERAVCCHTPSSQTDSMTDCNCDIFHRTIKAAVKFL